MSKFEDNMEEIFDIDVTAIEAKGEMIKQIDTEMSIDATKDYEYTRANLYNLIDKASEAINDVLDLARESNHPRAYEVAGNFIKQTADMTDKLIDLQKKIKDLDKGDKKSAAINGNVTNNMFFGTTADLQLMLKRGKVEEE
jgi:hypothetical protein